MQSSMPSVSHSCHRRKNPVRRSPEPCARPGDSADWRRGGENTDKAAPGWKSRGDSTSSRQAMTAASADAATAHVHLCRGPDDSTAWSNGYPRPRPPLPPSPHPRFPCRQDAQRSSELLDSLLSCAGIPSVPPPGRILSTPTQDRMRIVPNQVALAVRNGHRMSDGGETKAAYRCAKALSMLVAPDLAGALDELARTVPAKGLLDPDLAGLTDVGDIDEGRTRSPSRELIPSVR